METKKTSSLHGRWIGDRINLVIKDLCDRGWELEAAAKVAIKRHLFMDSKGAMLGKVGARYFIWCIEQSMER